MNFGWSAEERAWLEEVAGFIDGYGAEAACELRSEMRRLGVERFSPAFNAALARRGWLGLGWPVAGTHAGSETTRWILHEQIDCAGLPIYGVVQNEALGWMLLRHGPEALAAEHLPRIVDGTWNYAAGYSEPEAGSDLFALRTRGDRHGDHYVVSGSKLWTSAGHIADWIFAIVRTDPASTGAGGLSVMLIDSKSPGVEIQPIAVLGGWRVNACFFDDVEVPIGNIIGEENQGVHIVSTALDTERSMSYGRDSRLLLARLAYRLTGRSDKVSAATLERIGRLVAELEAERLLNLRILALAERHQPTRAEASMDKVYSSELAQRVSALVAECLGSEAQLSESDDPLAASAEEAVRATTGLSIIGGTNEMQRSAIARIRLGLPKEPS